MSVRFTNIATGNNVGVPYYMGGGGLKFCKIL